MSATDQAFIRAYCRDSMPEKPADRPEKQQTTAGQIDRILALDGPGTVPPPPHLQRPGKDSAAADQPARPATQPETLPSTANAAADRPARRGAQPLSQFVQQMELPDPDASFAGSARLSFSWPETCLTLGDRLRQPLTAMAERLAAAAENGCQVFGLAGCRRGEGRTTVLLSLARQLAAHETTVALVDADFTMPALARQLGLSREVGWDAVLRGDAQLEEALVLAPDERLAVLPLLKPLSAGDALDLVRSIRPATSLAILRHHRNVVLVDLGPILEPAPGRACLALVERAGIDCTLMIRDCRRTSPGDLRRAAHSLEQRGVTPQGVVETFAS